MISLNGVTLSEDLLWSNEFDTPAISQNIQRTILGVQIIQNMPIVGGRVVNLVAVVNGSEYFGFFTRSQIQEFKLLEQSGSSVVFHYEGQEFNVVIQTGGVQVQPLLPRPNQDTADLYSGTLILIEV